MEEQSKVKIGKTNIDKTLLELVLGILCWSIICQLSGVWFVKDKTGYSIGLWIGAIVAILSGIHMWWSLNKSLNFSQDAAVKMMTKYNIFRYLMIAVALALVMMSGFANPLSAFLALLGLKVAAYMQPFTHKVCSKFYKESEQL